MKRIWNWLISWDKDKVLHFALSMIIAMLSALVFKLFGADKATIVAVAWFAGFFAGVVKEIYDEIKYKGADEKDWAADALGTTLGTLLVLLFII